MTLSDSAHSLSITLAQDSWGARGFRCRVSLVAIAAGFLILRQGIVAETLQKQVLIEPKFVEVSDKSVRELGLSTRLAEKLAKLPTDASKLSSPATTNFGLGAAPSAETVGAHLFPGAGDKPGEIKLCGLVTEAQLQTILNSLRREEVAKIISAPAVRTQSDQPANIQVPSYPGLQRGNVAVVPRINPDGSIGMAVNVPPSTQLGESTGEKPPLVGDIPILGTLFRGKAGGKQDLLIFVKATVVDVLEPAGGGGSTGEVKVETIGTGDTIGHIADLKIQNLTDQPLGFVIPAMVLESKSRKNQDYVCPHEENVSLPAHEAKTVPVDGVCVNRGKPPVGKGVTGDLVVNTGDPNIPQNPDSHIPADKARDLLRLCTAKYDAAEKLQKDGALKGLPYKDKQKQKDIVVQWSTWSDPEISKITGAPPATKDDLKKVVYKQVEEKGPMSRETKKKVDQGIDTIFEKVELTSEKAKDLEKPDMYADTAGSHGTFEISDENEQTPMPWSGPLPKTKEKPKKPPKPKLPKEVQDWLNKKDGADQADQKKKTVQDDYNAEKKKFFGKSKHHGELEKARDEARQKADAGGASQQDKDNYKNAQNELDKNERELEKDFNHTEEGKKAAGELHDAEKEAQKAQDAAKDAEKKVPPGIDKDEAQKIWDEYKKAWDDYKKAVPAKW